MSYNWEGNIRQLKNLVTRVVTLARNDVIIEEDLPENLSLTQEEKNTAGDMKLDDVEKTHIINVLSICHGNQKKAADLLGIHRNTLARKIKEYNIKLK